MKDSLTKKEIRALRRGGEKIYNKYFTAYVGRTKTCGLAVAVSSKLGSAVVRNRIRRRIKESYRSIEGCRSAVFYPKFGVIKAKFSDLCSSIAVALAEQD